jgi:hypothetical protein
MDGWPAEDGNRVPSIVGVDCGWNQDIVLTFCEESAGYQPCKGFGVKQIGTNRRVGEKTESGWTVVWAPTSAGYELVQHPAWRTRMLDVKADHWKTWLHARLMTPVGQHGAMTLHGGGDHLGFTKHLTAEKKVEELVPKKGLVVRWEQVNRNNHFLDSTSLACVVAHAVGERLIGEPAEQKQTSTIRRLPHLRLRVHEPRP